MHLVGPSNSGLADPIELTAITLAICTQNFLLCPELTVERLVFCAVLDELIQGIGPLASLTAEETLRRHREVNKTQ